MFSDKYSKSIKELGDRTKTEKYSNDSPCVPSPKRSNRHELNPVKCCVNLELLNEVEHECHRPRV